MPLSHKTTILLIYLQFSILIASGDFSHTFIKSTSDEEIYQTALEIIRSKGYSAEEYEVGTEDGYVLKMQRIYPKKSSSDDRRNVVILQHGLLDSAHTWVNNLANESLGFILSDMGYDVWLANSRGSTYSQSHKNLSPDQEIFWEFSWDDMANLDLPAFFKFVINATAADKIFYIGHSQGTQIAFARLNSDENLRSRIAAMVALAPIAYLSNIRSPIHYLKSTCSSVISVVNWFGRGRFLPSNSLMRFLGLFLCRKHSIPFVCSNIIFLLAGYDSKNTNVTRLPVYIAHTPAGTSVQNMAHYCQSMVHGRFQAFDYGVPGNMRKYQQPTPPNYGLGNITVPLKVYWGGYDWLATPKDVQRLLAEIPQSVHLKDMFIPHYNHLDFVWGMDAAHLIYSDILDYLEPYR